MLINKIVYILFVIKTMWSLELPKNLNKKFDAVNKIIKLMKGKPGNELFLDIAQLEYPKANETLRRAYHQQWHEYYECLKNQIQDAGMQKTIYPIALLVFAGTSVKLRCKLCVSPAEFHMSHLIEWRYNSSTEADVPIEPSEHVIITPDEKDLHLYNVQMSEAGIYWCQLKDTLSAPYYLQTADEGTELTRSVRPETSRDTKNYPAPPENLDVYGLRVFTLWTPWSVCSTCDKVGQRTRYGYCTISLIEKSSYLDNSGDIEAEEIKVKKEEKQIGKEIVNENTEESAIKDHFQHQTEKRSIRLHRLRREVFDQATTHSSEMTTSSSEETTVEDTEDIIDARRDEKSSKELRNLARNILPIFHNRLPCRSKQTPIEIRKIPQIGKRKTEIMTGLCKVKCRKAAIFEIRDKSGNVLESANNSAGIFSMIQGLPEQRPSVERVSMYRKHGKTVTLICPGNLNVDVPVVWQVGTRVLVPSEIKEKTLGRISIDSRQRLFINKLRYADSRMYSCWQQGELAGTIRLEVTNEMEIKLDHRVFMIGATVIVGAMLTIFWKAFKGRKRISIG